MKKTTIYDNFINKIGVVSKEKLKELEVNSIDDLSEIKLKDAGPISPKKVILLLLILLKIVK